MNYKERKEEKIFDFFFDNLNPFNKLHLEEEDPETYFEEDNKTFYYKRVLLMYDKDELPCVIEALEEITGEQLANELNYINFQYQFDDTILMAFKNIQIREYVMTIEVLVCYHLTEQELRCDVLEEILN